jgi:YD repeat-containing protein
VAGQTTITISGTGDIDELRLFPVGTIMTTFTWSGLGSMTSRNDAGNRISYYEYDGLNRLVLIRDHDKNIVKRICYNFDGQPTDNCIVSLAPDWKESGIARCLKDANNNNTGYQEKEEVDVNPYSSTYNTKRWKIPVQNCTTCPMPPNWINTGNTKCEETDVAGRFTGRQLQEQVDANNCSASYNTIRWISLGCTSNCPNPEPYWMPTGNRRCVKDASNNNTGEVQVEYTDINECTVYGQKKWESGGYSCTECATPSTVPNWQPTGNTRCKQPGTTGEQEREEKDMNPCSAQFGNLRWASVGLNCAICPITNCLAPSNKVINCVCEAGVKNYVSSVYTKVGTVWKYKCTYFWCFSDALSSTQYFVEYHDTPCTVGGACLQ